MSSAAGIGRTRDPENNQSLNTIPYLSLEREVDRLFTQHSNTANNSNLRDGLNQIYDKARSLQDPGLSTSTTEKIGDYIHSRLHIAHQSKTKTLTTFVNDQNKFVESDPIATLNKNQLLVTERTTPPSNIQTESQKLRSEQTTQERISTSKNEEEKHYVRAAKSLTIMWGLIALGFASIASLFENLIQFVNIIGSLFYGTILGIFLVAFYLKKISGRSVLMAAIVSEIAVIWIYRLDVVAYLWLNLIGCVLVIILSAILQTFISKK